MGSRGAGLETPVNAGSVLTDLDKRRRDWGEPIALAVLLALIVALPNRYTLGGTILTSVLLVILAATCALSIFWTLVGSRRWTRTILTTVALVGGVALVTSLTRIVALVIYAPATVDGVRLIETSVWIWVSNVVEFAIVYHLIDDGDFVFQGKGDEAYAPVFFDYVFLSFTNSTAFSPTDTPPRTTRARMLMMLEAAIALTTLAIGAARAVNILH